MLTFLHRRMRQTVQFFLQWKAGPQDQLKPCGNHFETGFWPYEISFLLDETLLQNCVSDSTESGEKESFK